MQLDGSLREEWPLNRPRKTGDSRFRPLVFTSSTFYVFGFSLVGTSCEGRLPCYIYRRSFSFCPIFWISRFRNTLLRLGFCKCDWITSALCKCDLTKKCHFSRVGPNRARKRRTLEFQIACLSDPETRLWSEFIVVLGPVRFEVGIVRFSIQPCFVWGDPLEGLQCSRGSLLWAGRHWAIYHPTSSA